VAEPASVTPQGEVYDWYVRGLRLLDAGNPAAAAQLLTHAANAEPHARSVREALARAQYGSGRYSDAQQNFELIVETNPIDDYAHFGAGLSAARAGDYRGAVGHLALAAALRPENRHYSTALRGARARLDAG